MFTHSPHLRVAKYQRYHLLFLAKKQCLSTPPPSGKMPTLAFIISCNKPCSPTHTHLQVAKPQCYLLLFLAIKNVHPPPPSRSEMPTLPSVISRNNRCSPTPERQSANVTSSYFLQQRNVFPQSNILLLPSVTFCATEGSKKTTKYNDHP